VNIETPDTDAADALADLWVDLAREQRQHDARLLPDENREEIRGHIIRGTVTDGVRVARAEESDVTDENADDVGAGDILGFVMFSLEGDAFERSLSRGVVQNLYVRPGFRGEGIGSELLTTAEDELTVQGVEAIKLEVMAANEAARRFYRRHGYDPHRLSLETHVESDTHKTE